MSVHKKSVDFVHRFVILVLKQKFILQVRFINIMPNHCELTSAVQSLDRLTLPWIPAVFTLKLRSVLLFKGTNKFLWVNIENICVRTSHPEFP
jgi:hypothetical protein